MIAGLFGRACASKPPGGTPLRPGALAAPFFFLLSLPSGPVAAEPYLAVRQGLSCSGCHVNPTGGGLRSAAGNAFAQGQLAARHLDTGDSRWLGELNRFVAFGGDFRGSVGATDFPEGEDEDPEFAVDELRLYLDVRVIPDRLSVYFDQKLAPDGSRNLEAYGRLWFDESKRYYLKAGQMYLPFGFRLEDDSAFTRQITGISFDTPDKGVELGFESGPWNAQLAVSNGTAGGSENNSGKQWSFRGEHVRSAWRLGASYNFNDAGDTSRHMAGLHAGLRTGPIAWLVEADLIEDRGLPGGDAHRWVGLIEGNWMPRQGHNLKLTLERFEPDTDTDEDEQDRYSLVYEYAPFQFLQLRAGLREYDGVTGNEVQNRRFGFIELHGYF